MRIDTSLNTRDLPHVMDWLGAQIGSSLKTRVEDLERQERNNPLFTWYCRKAFSWEFALEEARRHRRLQGKLPRGDRFDTAYGFAAALQRVYQNLGHFARNQLGGRLRDAMKSQAGLRPIAHEIRVLTHLCKTGFDVQCMDLAGEARYDFLATRLSESVEIECKTTASDAGRKVHMRDVSHLGECLWPIANRLLDRPGFHLVLIEVPNRLSGQDRDVQAIARLVDQVIMGKSYVEDDNAIVDYRQLNRTPLLPDDSIDDRLRAVFLDTFGKAAGSIVLHGRVGGAALAIGVRSAQRDRVLGALANQAKDAAEQCTGTRPAVIAMALADEYLSRQQLAELVTYPSPLHVIVQQVVREEHRRHVDSIVFAAAPGVRSSVLLGVTEISGLAGVLHNPHPKFSSVTAREIFSVPA